MTTTFLDNKNLTFQIFIVVTLSLPAPNATPPPSKIQIFIFFCRLAVSELNVR